MYQKGPSPHPNPGQKQLKCIPDHWLSNLLLKPFSDGDFILRSKFLENKVFFKHPVCLFEFNLRFLAQQLGTKSSSHVICSAWGQSGWVH